MPASPIGRRGFIAASAAGGAALVTLGGIEYHADAKLDMEAMASQMEVPPAVAAYGMIVSSMYRGAQNPLVDRILIGLRHRALGREVTTAASRSPVKCSAAPSSAA